MLGSLSCFSLSLTHLSEQPEQQLQHSLELNFGVETARDMTAMEDALRPEWLAFVKELGFNPRIHGPTEADIRSQDAANGMAMVAKYTFPGPDESIEKIWHKTSSGTAVKSYKAATFKPDQPLLYYIHGGGFVLGSVDLDDRFCEIFAKELGCIVVSVEYRLAPEFKVSAV